jgi:tight adherence protein B
VSLLALAAGSSLAPFVLISAACGMLIGLSVYSLSSRRASVTSRIEQFVSAGRLEIADHRSLIERALGDKQARKIARSPYWEKLRVELEVANVRWSLERALLATFVATVALAWILRTTTRSPLGVALALFLPVVLKMVIGRMAERQRRMFSEQLPDNLQVISSAMRAGQTFVGALSAVVEDAPEPSKRELHRAVTDEALGVPLSDALGQVTQRMRSSDFQHVSIVAALQRDTGGNTAEVVDLVAETIRDRIELRRMVRALTAQGRLAGIILSMLPIGILLIISVINPSYEHPLFHSTGGEIALGAGVVMSILGSYMINRIVKIEV